jgi:hypothetical protein
MLRNAGHGPQSPLSIHRPQVPLANGQSKPLTVELLKQAGETTAGTARLASDRLLGGTTLGRDAKTQRAQELLTGLRVLLIEEYGRSTATLRPALSSAASADKALVTRALAELMDDEVAEMGLEKVGHTMTSAARMVNRFESASRNFAETAMKRPDVPLTSSENIHTCAYGLMNFALAEAAEDDDLARFRMDSRDRAGTEPVFKPDFRAACMEQFRAAMDRAPRGSDGTMTPSQINRVVEHVVAKIKQDNPPPPKLPSIEAWEGVAQGMDAKHERTSAKTAWGAAESSYSTPTSPSTTTSSAASAAGSPAGEVPTSEAQMAKRKKLGLDYD